MIDWTIAVNASRRARIYPVSFSKPSLFSQAGLVGLGLSLVLRNDLRMMNTKGEKKKTRLLENRN